MHVIIGGAHNGKKAYVEKLLACKGYHWLDCETDCKALSGSFCEPEESFLVIEHIECWLSETDLSETEALRFILEFIKDRNVVFILTDIGRGIVPMEADKRALRDACGRLYQALIAQADEVTRIWYGLAQSLKKRGEIR